jgi:hypothetical protein
MLRLLLRVREAMAGVFWVFLRVWEVGGGIRGIRSISTRPDLATFGSVLRRIRPSHWFNLLGSVLGLFFPLSISISLSKKQLLFPKKQEKQHQKTHPTNSHQASSIHGLVEPQYMA